jgi:hypothetical protein
MNDYLKQNIPPENEHIPAEKGYFPSEMDCFPTGKNHWKHTFSTGLVCGVFSTGK